MNPYSIGVDLGGTNLRAAAVDASGNMLAKVASATLPQANGDTVVAEIGRAIEALRAQVSGKDLAGVGVGVPGTVEREKGILIGAVNLPQLDGYPVRDAIARRIETHVILENDANAAALGEKWIGAGRDVDDLVLLTLGTGVGGGIISGGRVLQGYAGMAAELGHITVSPNGNPCGCGNNGCLEKHASAMAVSVMARLVGLGADLSSEDVYHLAAGGDDKARLVFRTAGEALGVALANLINIFNFPLYLLSGGLLPAWEFFAPAMMAEVTRRSFIFRNAPTRIVRAQLGNEAGQFGAAYLPFRPY
jgi:glucokinase